MFVKIEKEEGITPITIDVWIKKVREDGFSPDEAMQVLKWSNFYGNIKQVVKEINKLETAEERLAFKDFVLSAVDGRKTTPEAFEGLFKLAMEGGYAKELLTAYSKDKIYDENDVNVSVFISGVTDKDRHDNCVVNSIDLSKYDVFIGKTISGRSEAFSSLTKEKYSYYNYPKKCVFRDSREVCFNSYSDYSMIESLSFENIYSVSFSGVNKMPKRIDVSDCDNVDFCGVDLSSYKDLKFKDGAIVKFSKGTKFPEVLDLSALDEVDLKWLDFRDVKEIKFKKGAKVNLSGATNLPANIDFSGLKKVDLSNCDLGNVKDVRFMDGAIVNLTKAKNVSSDVDISKLSEVMMNGCSIAIKDDFSAMDVVDLSGRDLSNWDNMKFKEGAKVILKGAKNFPKKLDLSKVIVDDMRECDFSGVEEIKFSPCKNVLLNCAINLPEVLDFSQCESVSLSYCDLSKVKEIKFKNCKELDLDGVILPEKLDLSEVKQYNRKLVFTSCDFSHVKEIKFKEHATALFRDCKFTEELDLSQLVDCAFYDSDLSKSKHIKFNEKARVDFSWSCRYDGIPEVLDVSELNNVSITINSADVALKQIKFKEGAIVKLDLSCSLDNLDLSKCGDGSQLQCNYNRINKITFKDRAQRDKFLMEKREWEITVIKKKSKFLVGRFEEMFSRFGGGKE